MSQTAELNLIDISKLESLKGQAKPRKSLFGGVKDNYFNFLKEESTLLKEYKWSGGYFATLFVYLEEKGINLMESKYNDLSTYICETRNISCFIFEMDHKEKLINMLDPSKYSETDLKKYYEEFNEMEDEDSGIAMLDGIKLLFENLSMIDSAKKVIVFSIY